MIKDLMLITYLFTTYLWYFSPDPFVILNKLVLSIIIVNISLTLFECPVFGSPLYIKKYVHFVFNVIYLQWGLEYRTCSDFEWSTKFGFRMAFGFRMVKQDGCHFVRTMASLGRFIYIKILLYI